ncbi:HET-domain-containing protein [Dendrothele bispora CBS 962.96]|uniref:HET-domain-containing protein n=1 Tax=Dendrothele bispora (strain CBS 962.96) TaxID=1314807 RepID=A0A4S8MCZ0_DENBC|nr:HET-domain-containing protein [Dendrothele bispora CBS 962.96]
MRLINTTTLQVAEFLGIDVPPYAILSHTWGTEEVTFHEMILRTEELAVEATRIEQKSGFVKIQKSCQIAKRDGFEYIWNDTCCIDKESSAELSEAINSMYGHYGGSGICYAYLVDVSRDVFLREIQDNNSDDEMAVSASLWKSRWFTRGWTLQELLAPSNVVFYDKDWLEIGTRTSLADLISVITMIPTSVLTGGQDLKSCSIAQRMSWAARRRTTRAEDLAYCLMGIFGVGMPTLYGEGAIRAFIRLQEEIIKYNDDATIFAWRATSSNTNNDSEGRGLLAWSPSEFIDSGKITTVQGWPRTLLPSSDHIVTNHGLRITLLDLEMSTMIIFLGMAILSLTVLIIISVRFKSPNTTSPDYYVVLYVSAWILMILSIIIQSQTPHFAISSAHSTVALHFLVLVTAAHLSGDMLILGTTENLLCGYLIWNLFLLTLTMLHPKFEFVNYSLPCQIEDGRFLAIYLKRVPESPFIRAKPDQIMLVQGSGLRLAVKILTGLYRKDSIYVKEAYLKGTFSTKRKSVNYRFRLSFQDFQIINEYPIRGDQNLNPSPDPDSVILDAKRTTLKLRVLPESENPQEFALTFGRVEEVGDSSGNRVWLDILTNIPEEESLEDIYRSYDFSKRRSDLRTRALFESLESLTEDRCVSVVIRRAADSDNPDNDHNDSCDIETYEVNVRAVPGNASQLYRENALLMRSKYVFAVWVENTEDVLTQEFSPKKSCVDKHGIEELFFMGTFFVKDSEISAPLLVIFSCKESRNELFTLSFDIYTGKPRVDVNVPPSAAQATSQLSSPKSTNRRRTPRVDCHTLEFMKFNDRVKFYVDVDFELYNTPHRFITHQARIRIYQKERSRNDRTRPFFISWGGRLIRNMQNEVTNGGVDTVSERKGDINLAEIAV